MPLERFFTCNLCESMCGLRVETEGGRVTALAGDRDDVFSRGHLCPKAYGLKELLEDPDRLRFPVIREGAAFRRATWDEALDVAGSGIRELQARHGRDAVGVYVGNPVVHSHRSSLASQLLTVAVGSKNRFDPNSQDSNPRLFACMQVYGDALSMPIPDLDRIEHLLILGANPAVSMGSQLALGDPKARFAAIRARGGTVVLVDPRRSESAAWCTAHHFIRPGGDAALLFAILHVLFTEELVDVARVDRVASGVRDLRALARSFTPARVAPAIGIAADTIRELARGLASTSRAAVYARVGVCQSAFGPVASWLVEAVNLVIGSFDRPGGSMFPTPATDVAPLGRLLVGNHYGRFRSRVRGLPEMLGALPSGAMAEEMETEGEGRIRGMVVMAGNPVLSTPNGARLDRAFAALEHVVAIDFYVNETTRHARVILPPSHVFETGNYDLILSRFTVRNVAKYSAPILATGDDTRDDWSIAVDLAMRLRLARIAKSPSIRARATAALRGLPERIVDALLRVGPYGTSLEALRASPHGVDLGPLVPSDGSHVRTRDKRARLVPPPLVADVPRIEAWVDAPREPVVLVGRRHVRSNNSWMHNVRSLVKGPDRAILVVHPIDAQESGIADGARVRVTSRVGAIDVTARVSDEVMPGVVSLPHGYGHAPAKDTLRVAGALPGESANTLTDDALLEPVIGTSILNGVPVTIAPAGAA